METLGHSSVPHCVPFVHLGYLAAAGACGAPRSGVGFALALVLLGAVVIRPAKADAGSSRRCQRRRVRLGIASALIVALLASLLLALR